jgi:hypothetical protein
MGTVEIVKVFLAIASTSGINLNGDSCFTFGWPGDSSFSAMFLGFSGIFGEMPSVTPGAEIGAQIFWRVRGRDLVCGSGQGFAFRCVHALPAYGAF